MSSYAIDPTILGGGGKQPKGSVPTFDPYPKPPKPSAPTFDPFPKPPKPMDGITPPSFGGVDKTPKTGTPGMFNPLAPQQGLTQGQFGPGQNLIGTQFGMKPLQSVGTGNHTTSNKTLQGLGGMLGAGQVGSFNYNQDQQGVRGQAVSQLAHMLNTDPERNKLAADSMALLEERSQPGFDQQIRSVGQKAAAFGRIGAGLTTSELGDVTSNREKMLDQSRRQLATESAQQMLDDRYKKLMAAQGLGDSLSQQDLGAGSINQGYNQMALDEGHRAFGRGMDFSNEQYGRESDQYGRARDERNYSRGDQYDQLGVNRGERDWQYGLERDALGDRERQYGMEEDSYQRDFDRDMRMAEFGYGQNPAGAYGAQASQRRDQATQGMANTAPLFYEWARRRNQPAPPSGQVPSGTQQGGADMYLPGDAY